MTADRRPTRFEPAFSFRKPGLVLAALLACEVARASNGASPIAISGRAAGRGGADTAIADDGLGLFSNPAGMGTLGLLRVDAQDMPVWVRSKYVNPRNDDQTTFGGYLTPAAGVVVDPFWGEPASVPMRVGFGFAGVAGAGGTMIVHTSVYPEGEKEGLSFGLLRVGPGVELELLESLRVGLGVFYNYLNFSAQSAATSSGGNAKGPVQVYRNPDGSVNNPPKPFLVNGQQVTWDSIFALGSSGDSNSSARFELEPSSANGINFNLGLQYDVTPWCTLGLTYTSPAWFFNDLSGTAHIDASRAIQKIQSDPRIQSILGPVLDAYLPDGHNATFLADYDYKIANLAAPQIVSFGVALTPLDNLGLALDVRWVEWSKAFESIQADLTNGTNRNINAINGSGAVSSQVRLDWKDIIVVGTGVTFAPLDWLALRAGYNFATNPLPTNEVGPGTVGFLEHHVTGGTSVSIYEGLSATLAVVYALPGSMTVNQHKTNPEYSYAALAGDQLFLYIGLAFDM